MNDRTRKLIKYVVPSILSMVSVFLFTVVDGIFVGQGVGTDALGAVNIAFPFVMVCMAVAMLTTVGGLTITAIRKGRGDEDGANDAFLHSFALTVIVGIISTILGTVFVKDMAKLVGANDTFFDLTCEYLFWYSVFMLPCLLNTFFLGMCRNDGDPVRASLATIISTALNIFGDWLLVFPLHMGLTGAAVATGVSQTVGLLISLSHFALKKGKLRFKLFKPDFPLFGKILLRGLPECISQFNAPLSIIFTNIVILKMLGDTAENAFSVIGYVAAFSIAVFLGVAEGLQPIFGNCYGARNITDLKWYKRMGLIIGFSGSLIIYLLLIKVGEPICRLYGLDAETMKCTMDAMPIYSLGFLIQSFTVILSAYLYSTTRTKEAVIINVLRSFVINAVVTLLLPEIAGPDSVWFTMPAYEFIVLIIAAIITITADSRLIVSSERE